MPRDQKFQIADRIQGQASDLLEMLLEAYYSPQNQKIPILAKVNIKLELLRYYIRLLHDLKFITTQRYGYMACEITEIGKMLGGWIKSLNAKPNP